MSIELSPEEEGVVLAIRAALEKLKSELKPEELKIILALSKGHFFNPSQEGVKRVRVMMTSWPDDYTQEQKKTFLFSRTGQQLSMPPPNYFAIFMGNMGWWTSDLLLQQEFKEYIEKVETVKAKFLELLANPFFYKRFAEIARDHELDPEKLIMSIKIKLPARKIHILSLNKSQREEIINCYMNDINRRTLKVVRQLRTLLTKGTLGRRRRIEILRKHISVLRMLNAAGCMADLIEDLDKVFGAVENLQRRYFPNDIDKYANDERCSKPIRAEILRLAQDAQNPENWRLRK